MIKILLLSLLFALPAFLFLKGFVIKGPEIAVVRQATQNIPTLPKINLETPPESKLLSNTYHIFQTFNNCGPAALSMALSYYDINVSQAELGDSLRPYQVPGGENDDKSVTLTELAEKAKDYDLIPFHRPDGNIEQIKLFITYNIPVITRTWLKENEDIGHYRVVKGYDQTHLIQDDSLQGKNLKYTPSDFNKIWKKFNYEYLVLVPQDKKEIAETIIGENKDSRIAWQNAVYESEKQLEQNPDDIDARFNLSVALYNIRDYKRATEEFEKVESRLPFRALWYQIEPIKAYFELGDYQRVLDITEKVINYHNRAYSEAYLLRGEVFKKQGNIEAAKAEFEKAVQYNVNLKEAKETLNSL